MSCLVMHVDVTERRFYDLILWDRKNINIIEDYLAYPVH